VTSAQGVPVTDSIAISCDDCRLRHTDTCDDCLVSFVLGREPDDALVIDADEAREVRRLAETGLVPRLRFSSSTAGRAAG
jgi:hypothetical protein